MGLLGCFSLLDIHQNPSSFCSDDGLQELAAHMLSAFLWMKNPFSVLGEREKQCTISHGQQHQIVAQESNGTMTWYSHMIRSHVYQKARQGQKVWELAFLSIHAVQTVQIVQAHCHPFAWRLNYADKAAHQTFSTPTITPSPASACPKTFGTHHCTLPYGRSGL